MGIQSHGLVQCSPKERITGAFENRSLEVFWTEKKTNKKPCHGVTEFSNS